MFSIDYLYQIRNNFAIIYGGINIKIIEDLKIFHEKAKKTNKDLNLFLFIKNTTNSIDDNIYNYNHFDQMKEMFIMHYEFTSNEKIEHNILEIL